MTRTGIYAVIVAGLLCSACGNESKQPAGTVGTSGQRGMTVTEALTGDVPPFVSRDAEGTKRWKLTRQFYQNHGDEPAWIRDRKPLPQMDDLIAALQAADREGLDPALYNLSVLSAKRQEAGRGFLTTKGFDPAEASKLDVWLTYLYINYASDLSHGLADLSRADPSWKMRDKKIDLLSQLQKAVDDNRVRASLDELVPRHPQYVSLRDALAKYRDIAKNGGWQPLPGGLKLKPGQSSPEVPALAKRLAVTGDYQGGIDPNRTDYNVELQEAVKRFQRRHGLEPDGTVGPAVVTRMNVPVERRISEIALNLERWRWLPQELGPRHIFVNLPEFRLEVWDQKTVPLSMRVVVGKKDTPTPIFADDMTYLVFSPYWNVPPDIAKNETLPSALKDPAFLQRTNMEVVDKSGNPVDPSSVDLEDAKEYRFRQRPGAANSLGLVKFMFPNSFNVYLHDTPADSLFARATRSYSHGCVRVEQPEKLAQYVLGDQAEWTPERISEAMHAGQERTVKLSSPLPVYLGYWTARVAADGILQFRDDMYGIDGRQMALLTKAIERLKSRATHAVTAFRTTDQSSPAADRSLLASTAIRPR